MKRVTDRLIAEISVDLAQNLVDVTSADPSALAEEMRVAEAMLASATDDTGRMLAHDAIAALKLLNARAAA